ncbi:hypothetical protein MN608_11709 [Microdochium nivale]|nr:hypothetical protein MN608_11709 [Microdochium nivale]
MQNGSSVSKACNQNDTTINFRIFAYNHSRHHDLLCINKPKDFSRKIILEFLMSYLGASLGNDIRQAEGKPYFEYHPALLPLSVIPKRLNYDHHQPSYEKWDSLLPNSWGETTMELMGPKEDKGKPIDMFEMPNSKAGHFLLHDHLELGFDACTYETLVKSA